ncbi:MAG: hypothetical protein EOP81_09830 [Variovorax sp.]|nr:MAG: hypothetical protein EOP81_09830 [Variovorax sp.]
MSDTAKPFAFSQFVPGFDFLKNLATGGGTGSGSAIPGLANWVAPTLSVEEVDKRIQELKTVQFWLEQNSLALKATIQALEVQKMTLSTLRGMNVRMEDLANAFTRPATPTAAAPAPAAPAPASPPSFFASAPVAAPATEVEPAPEPEAPVAESAAAAPKSKAKAKPTEEGGAGVVDPLQWWGSLTQQFQEIASSALQDAAQLKMPAVAQPLADAVKSVISAGQPGGKTSTKNSAKTSTNAPAKKTAPAARKRAAAKKAPARKAASTARKR